jgi:2-oxoglutarate dehydrogenase E2 component (dihydrolipoamide succinyltransferase)
MTSEIKVPELGESVVSARISRWLKRQGESVAAGEPVVALETEKVDLEIAAEAAGVLAQITRQEGEEVKIGEVLGLIEEVSVTLPATPAAGQPATIGAQAPSGRETPARETGAASQPASPRPSSLPDTVERGARSLAPSSPGLPAGGKAEAFSGTERAGREERVRMSRRRLTIARRLVEVQQTAAMLTTFNEVDMGPIQEIRSRRKESFRERHGVGLGITSFFVKAAVAALKSYPPLNAEIQDEEIVLKRYYDIGIAMDAAEGLVVPVLRDADRLSVAEIEEAIRVFARKTTDGSLSLEDLRGGTFTITNGGVFGSLLSTPILNPPQVGILGLHKIEERPVVRSGTVSARPMMYVALTYDHRIVDGREAVAFLVRIKELIEQPEELLLEG